MKCVTTSCRIYTHLYCILSDTLYSIKGETYIYTDKIKHLFQLNLIQYAKES